MSVQTTPSNTSSVTPPVQSQKAEAAAAAVSSTTTKVHQQKSVFSQVGYAIGGGAAAGGAAMGISKMVHKDLDNKLLIAAVAVGGVSGFLFSKNGASQVKPSPELENTDK